jgi:hypothetical protein
VVKAIVAVVGESGSFIVTRGIGHGSDLNQEDFGADDSNCSALKLDVPRPDMEEKSGKF